MSKEIWKEIPGLYGDYLVSNKGRVLSRSRKKSRILRQSVRRGYAHVCLWDTKKKKKYRRRVNRLVALVFHGKPKNRKMQALHKDGDSRNNHASNIRWGTHLENEADKDRMGTRPRGMDHANRKLTASQVRQILSAKRYFGYKKDLARKFGVSVACIKAVRNRRLWRWLRNENVQRSRKGGMPEVWPYACYGGVKNWDT